MNCPLSRTSANRASSSARTGAHWALTSTRGICCTATHFSGVDQIRRQHENACNDDVFDVLEVGVEACVARAEPVADAGEGERPDRGTDERQNGVRSERHLEDTGRDRDERADERRHAPDEDADVAPPLEPPLGTVETLRSHVQPAAPALEQRTAAVAPDPPADQRSDEVTERPGEGDHEEGPDAEADL